MTLHRIFPLAALVALVGCGGGDSSSGGGAENQSSTQTGVFLDSPVTNIGYHTDTKEGVTNARGEFEYEVGEMVTFFIGDLELPPVSAKGTVTPLDIAQSKNTSDQQVVNIVRLLQTLDEDGNPDNGITIPETAKSAASQVDFSSSESDFEALTVNLVANSGSTNVALVPASMAVAHFESTLSNTPLSSESAIDIPEKTISIDGIASDWAGVQPIGMDPAGDQNGNSSTDLVKVSIARSGDMIALLMETAGDIKLYHTPGSDYSHYEIGFHFFDDSNCSGPDNGFFIVNNFTDSIGRNYHRIEEWFSDDGTRGDMSPTTTAHSGKTLETSFSTNALPRDKGSYISLNPYVQSFGQNDVSTAHDDLESEVCFRLPTD